MLGLTGRTVTILALMCLISHNLPVESAVQKRIGTNLFRITAVRLIASFVGAFALNYLLPEDSKQLILGREREEARRREGARERACEGWSEEARDI